jgi:hypothetical protein
MHTHKGSGGRFLSLCRTPCECCMGTAWGLCLCARACVCHRLSPRTTRPRPFISYAWYTPAVGKVAQISASFMEMVTSFVTPRPIQPTCIVATRISSKSAADGATGPGNLHTEGERSVCVHVCKYVCV